MSGHISRGCARVGGALLLITAGGLIALVGLAATAAPAGAATITSVTSILTGEAMAAGSGPSNPYPGSSFTSTLTCNPSGVSSVSFTGTGNAYALTLPPGGPTQPPFPGTVQVTGSATWQGSGPVLVTSFSVNFQVTSPLNVVTVTGSEYTAVGWFGGLGATCQSGGIWSLNGQVGYNAQTPSGPDSGSTVWSAGTSGPFGSFTPPYGGMNSSWGPPFPTVSGTVTLSNGASLPSGSTVTVCRGPCPNPGFVANVGAGGSYSVTLWPNSPFNLFASVPFDGSTVQSPTVTLTANYGQVITGENFVVTLPGTVTGAITYPGGAAPPPSANLGLVICPGTATSTQCPGVKTHPVFPLFSFPQPPGQYEMAAFENVNGQQVLSAWEPVTVVSGQSVNQNFVLPAPAPPTTLIYSGPSQGDAGSPVVLSAVLQDQNGNPIAGQTVQFSEGSATCSGTTDATGTARCVLTTTGTHGTLSVQATFMGTSAWAPSSAWSPFNVNDCGATPSGVNLHGANLKGANLIGMNLEDANLQGANLQGARLQGANLTGALLQGANLQGVNGTNADFCGADLQGANLQESVFNNANFDNDNLAGANLQSDQLANANLAGTDLAGSNLQNAVLTGADLADANAQGANLQGANLTEATLMGATTKGANMKKIVWSSTTCVDGTNSTNDGGTCVGHL